MDIVYKIYRITNLITNRIYIGQTIKSIQCRFSHHVSNKRSYISKSINKYGKENFKIEWIASSFTKESTDLLEEYFILLENSMAPNGYNLMTSGTETLRSEVFKEVMSSETRKRWDSTPQNERTNGFKARPIIGINDKLEVIEFLSTEDARKNGIYPDFSLKYNHAKAKGYSFFYYDEIDKDTLISKMNEVNEIRKKK